MTAAKPMKVAVLMGGTSFERDFSLNSGRNIVRTLEAAGHTVLPLDTSPELVPILREQQPDVAYIALHGKNGEDGTVQSLLEYLGIPYVGQRPSVCRLAWPKAVLPHVVLDYRRIMGVGREDGAASWPEYLALNKACFKEMGAATALDRVSAWFATGYPLAVKPMRGGSAMGVSRVDSQDELAEALFDALSYDDEVLIEEWISGVELAVTVISTGDEVRALAPVEIVPLEKESFFSTQVRFDGLWQSYCPPRPESLVPGGSEAAAEAALAQITEAALEVYRAFGCRDLSRVDIIWDGKAPRVLEMNVSPGMGEGSLVPLACSAAGLPLASVLEQLLAAAVARQAVML